MKVIAVQELTLEGLAKLAPAITTIARAEGLEAHARSVEVRRVPAKSSTAAGSAAQAVLKMAPYHPPTGGRARKLRLDFNENTVGCSPKVLEYLSEELTEAPRDISGVRRNASARLGRLSSASRRKSFCLPTAPMKRFRC